MHVQHVRLRCVLVLLAGLAVAGCYRESRQIKPIPPTRTRPARVSAAEPDAYGPAMPETIHIDTTEVGAEAARSPARVAEVPRSSHQLAFQVTGYGVEPETGSPVERKRAAIEAAVIDALGRAAREIQRDPETGLAPVEYRLPISPSLTIFGQLVSGAPQTVVMVNQRGRITELCARNGVLAHPPHDANVVQQVFAAADGRLVLLGTRVTIQPGRHSASVGYYRKHEASATTQSPASQPIRPVISTRP